MKNFKLPKFECVFCGKEINGYGHNPAPVLDDGRCCWDCNLNIPLKRRLSLSGMSDKQVDKIINYMKKYPQTTDI